MCVCVCTSALICYLLSAVQLFFFLSRDKYDIIYNIVIAVGTSELHV